MMKLGVGRWLLGVLLVWTTQTTWAVLEKSTGFDFPATSRVGKLRSLGVRKKGPIKVYGVGMYENFAKDKGFILKMAMGVGAGKMTNALVDAVKPRLPAKDVAALDDFKALLLKGLPNGCSRNMCLLFATGSGKLSLFVDDAFVGAVASKPLATAFVGVYCDANAVCKLSPIVV